MMSMKMNSLSEIGRLVDRAERVQIIAHVQPDGDTVGAALALGWALRTRGIDAALGCADPVPRELRFLPGSESFSTRIRGDGDLVLVIDCSSIDRVGHLHDAQTFASLPVVNIDHHETNTRFGDLNLVAHKAATVELVLELILHLGIALDATIATCLLTGLVTDTRCFRTSNTTTETVRVAHHLMEAGASLPAITDALYNHETMAMIRLTGAAFSISRLSGGIVWTQISQETLQSTGSDMSDSSGLVNALAACDEARVAAVFREMGEGRVDVSLRSRPGYDVSAVALSFGGGGHLQAAGCQVDGTLAEVSERVLVELQRLVARGVDADGGRELSAQPLPTSVCPS